MRFPPQPFAVLLACLGAGPATSTSVPSATRPSLAAVVADNTRLSADLPYVAGPARDRLQTLDVYAPAGATGAPVVVYVHGGEWQRGDKADVAAKPRLFNAAGVVFVAVNFRLSPKAVHPAQVDDVAAAVRWTVDHAADYGGDGRRVVLVGHSAGCHLAALVGLDPRPLATVGLRPADLAGVVCWVGGGYDLTARDQRSRMYGPPLNATFGPTEAQHRDASPSAHVADARPAPPFLIASGAATGPTGEPAGNRAAADLAARLSAAGGSATIVDLPGKTISTSDYDLGQPGDHTGEVLLDFVRRVTRRDGPATRTER